MPRPVGSFVAPIDGGKAELNPGSRPEGHNPEASLAHEINNPLVALLNLLYLAESYSTLPDQVRRYLALARDEAQRISQITHGAMQKFQPSEGLGDTNIPNLMRSVVNFYKSRFESRGISVCTRYCGDGNLSAYEAPLRQTFSNLLLNASDAMPNGGRLQARVSTATEWSGERRHGLRVTVADNGCGIDTRDVLKIWEPLFSTKGTSGNGLGLSFVKETVQKHRGVLRVRSSTKQGHSGSVFTIFLPA
jgi:signal transduction histidine kinase